MAKAITKKPSKGVSKLSAPVRAGGGSHNMTATWKIPKDLVDDDKKDRATSLEIDWYLGVPGKDPKYIKAEKNEKTKSHSINLNSLTIGRKTYTRNSFYPMTTDTLKYVTVSVTPKNKKGKGGKKTIATQTRNFVVPRAPAIDALSFNNSNGVVSTTIRTNAGEDYAERYDTVYYVTVTNPFVNGGKAKNLPNPGVWPTSTAFSVSYDASQYMNLSYTQYIKVTVSAYARGYAGASSWATPRTLYVSYPAQATINSVSIDELSSVGKCTVKINTNSSATHPVDRVKLQYAADVEYDVAEDIPAAEWQDTEIVDNKNCTALSVPVGDLIPSRGNHTWVRVATYHLNDNVLFRYSKPWMVKDLEKPSTPAAEIDIDALETYAGADGLSAVVHLGWNKDGRDDFTGTELSWSDSKETWKSTEDPSSYRFTWSDGPETFEGVSYRDSATITIKGLSEGKLYYIKARRYLEAETEQFSEYVECDPVLTSEAPSSLVAMSESFVADGDPLTIYWTFSGNGIQTAWEVINTATGITIAEGVGSNGSVQISAERLKEVAVDNVISYRVDVSTGGEFTKSEVRTVTIIEQPTLSITSPATLTEQPYSFTATSNRLCDLITIVSAQGISGQTPVGMVMQPNGDTVHSDAYVPEWTDNNGVLTSTIRFPKGLDFWDSGKYTISVVAVDRETHLRSPEAKAEFTVDWINKAVDINDGDVTLTVIDTTDEDGDHTQAVQIDLTPPEGCAESDVYDIYRMDIENPSLIGESFPLTYTAVDEYAPFGTDTTLSYRIALRTVDGDVSFTDVEYEAECKNMRFDWAGGSLELPYGLSIGDSFKKDAEIRQHMDGSSDGYWNQNIERKSSLNSSIIKILQPNDIERARNLARYAGPVFVRLPNGSAFVADVQISDMSVKNEAVTSIAIDATEIGLTQDFALPIPFTLEEEQQEG